MEFISVGSLIERARKEQKKITRKKLVNGLCSEQFLVKIEASKCETDILMADVLLQRLGKSADKLEMVISKEAYRLVKIRDLIEETIMRNRRTLANAILDAYPVQTNVDKMYQSRMRACMLYRIDKDYEGAIRELQNAIQLTLPKFSYERIENYLISTMEMENLLALERVSMDKNPQEDKEGIIKHLELCRTYIDGHFGDEEEHAKIYAKCVWLLATAYFEKGQSVNAMSLCEKAIEELRKNTMIYFMLPLLQLVTQIGESLGIDPERNKYAMYEKTLSFLWKHQAKDWYPIDLLFHNCYQKEYHLDYELIREERKANHISQESLIEGIYQNAESLSRLENGKATPNKRTFEKLMEKLSLEKGRYNGFVATDSFEIMELRRKIDIELSRNAYEKADNIVKELKKQLDMNILENKKLIEDLEILIQQKLHVIPIDEAIKRQKEILISTYIFEEKKLRHIPMRNEVLLITHFWANLIQLGNKEEAMELYSQVLQCMKESKVSTKYRYRSFSLVLTNYAHEKRDETLSYDALRNELVCGKASVIPFCIINILVNEREKKNPQDCLVWEKAVYYLSDMFYFEKIKSVYKSYIEQEYKDIILI